MLVSWANFFFVSFDPAGFISLDKPPLGYWAQALSALIFGYQGWSLILPQALAGVLSVFLLYWLVKETSGSMSGILAALFMVVTPILVATDRNNTIDSLVALTSILAAGAILQLVKTGKRCWLWVAMVMIGVGFNIKMLQAYLVLPACLLVYLVCISRSWREKLIQIALSGLLLVGISLSWMTIVDLTPSTQRPFVGGSTNNSEFDLAFKFNGIDRIAGLSTQQDFLSNGPGQGVDGMMTSETGLPGAWRLFSKELAGQVTWLMPISCFCLLYLLTEYWRKTPIQFSASLLWGAWLITGVLFFSFAAFFHRQYLVMLAPPVAALAGMGISRLWDAYQQDGWKRWLLPLVVLLGIATMAIIITPFSGWNRSLLIPLLLIGGCSVAGLIVAGMKKSKLPYQFSVAFLSLGIVSLIIPQAVWAAIPVITGGNRALPFAGPDVLTWRLDPPDKAINDLATSLEDILNHPDNGKRFALGTFGVHYAHFLIVLTGKPIMAIGGYQGNDPVPMLQQLASDITSGVIRYFFLNKNMTISLRPDIWNWITGHCQPLKSRPTYDNSGIQLFDCKNSTATKHRN